MMMGRQKNTIGSLIVLEKYAVPFNAVTLFYSRIILKKIVRIINLNIGRLNSCHRPSVKCGADIKFIKVTEQIVYPIIVSATIF